MPIYEYRCHACGHQLEAIQKLSEAPLKTCPACGQEALQKQLSAPAFRLSGSGWYETDFKSDKEKRRNLSQSEGTASPDKAGDSGSRPDKPRSEPAPAATTAKAE